VSAGLLCSDTQKRTLLHSRPDCYLAPLGLYCYCCSNSLLRQAWVSAQMQNVTYTRHKSGSLRCRQLLDGGGR
jgi:hypothetical protein